MTDFRDELYRKYVSTFKGSQSNWDIATSQAYWKWCDGILRPLLRQVSTDARILEVGCGQGYLMGYLRNLGFLHVQGIDVSEEQIVIAKTMQLQVEVADAAHFLRSNTNTYGAILAFDVLEHFSKEELLRLVALIRDSLEVRGVLILQTVNGQGLFSNQILYGDLTHLTILNPGSLEQVLRYAGFEEIVILESNPVASGILGRLRRALWTTIKCAANAARWVESGKTQRIWTENMICMCRKSTP